MSVEILAESRRMPESAPPPPNAAPHLWLEPEARSRIADSIAGGDTLAAYISRQAEAKMRNHALAFRDSQLEVMGLLLGEVREWNGTRYVVARDAVTTDLDATSVSVRFDPGGFEALFAELDGSGFDYVLVGWYHSHPGYGCFLSGTDIATHSGAFVSPHQVAVVIDPLQFRIAAFRLDGQRAVEMPFAVYWDRWDDPYGGLKKLRR